jgi:hypothetical protein
VQAEEDQVASAAALACVVRILRIHSPSGSSSSNNSNNNRNNTLNRNSSNMASLAIPACNPHPRPNLDLNLYHVHRRSTRRRWHRKVHRDSERRGRIPSGLDSGWAR